MSSRYSSLKAPMEKFGTKREASPLVMSKSIISLFTVTGIAEVGICKPFPSNLNFAIGRLGGLGSSVLASESLEVVNET